MNATPEKKQNKALPLLLVLLVAAIFAGGYFFMGNKHAPSSAVEEPVVEAAKDETPVVEQTTEAAPETPVALAPSEPVKFSIGEAIAPRAIGQKDAPVKITEYASLTCSHCGHFHKDTFPKLKEKYIDTGKVYFEFREFPLNDPALKASLIARCLPADKYEPFITLLFKTQEQWAQDINYMNILRQNAKLAGLGEETLDQCLNEPKLKVSIAEAMQKAQDKWKINSTPTFVINDTETISGAVALEEFERIFAKVTKGVIGTPEKVE